MTSYLIVSASLSVTAALWILCDRLLRRQLRPARILWLGRLALGVGLLAASSGWLLPVDWASSVKTSVPKISVTMLEFDRVFPGGVAAPARPEVAPGERGGLLPAVAWPLLLLLLGHAIVGTRLLLRFVALRRSLRSAVRLKRVGRVEVLVSDRHRVPFSTIMTGRATVVLPIHVLGSNRDRDISIAHELQHHRQRDTWWVVLHELLKLAFYWNPLVYALVRRMSELQELTCDAAVLGRRRCTAREYTACLVRAAERLSARRDAPSLSAAMASRPLLIERITQLKAPTRISSWSTHYVCLSLAVIVAANGLIACGNTGAETANATAAAPAASKQRPLEANAALRSVVAKPLAQAIQRTGARRGVAIVADPRTGQVFAAVELDRSGEDLRGELVSRATEPWSLIKPLTAAIALERGAITSDAVFDGEDGTYAVAGRRIRDYRSFGALSTADVIVNSSNIGAVKIAQTLQAEALGAGLAALGIGGGVGKGGSFPSTARGSVGDPDAVALALGSGGIAATPLEIVRAYSAIANGGRLPSLMRPGEVAPPGPRVLSTKTAARMRSILGEVVSRGTGRHAASPHHSVAGKTASGPLKDGIAAAAFVGFAPREDPRLVIYVRLELPKQAIGGRDAAPVFRAIVDLINARGLLAGQG